MSPAGWVFLATLGVAIANEAALWAQLALLGGFVVLMLAPAFERADDTP